MRRIAIVGSRQAGLLAARGLLQAGYDVELYSDRPAEGWLEQARPTGTAVRFARSLAYERALGSLAEKTGSAWTFALSCR